MMECVTIVKEMRQGAHEHGPERNQNLLKICLLAAFASVHFKLGCPGLSPAADTEKC